VTALLVKAVVAAAVALALARAFMGPAPQRMHPELAMAAGFVGLIGYPVAIIVAAGRHPETATVVLAGSVILMALAVWAARGPGDDGGEEVEHGPDPPVDWESFDLERERWERTPAR
jgi:hypothetical protein